MALWIAGGVDLLAEHRATRLGAPATRFADPLVSAEDLRWRFRDPKLREDIADVLRQWGWQGRLEDLFEAAEKAPLVEWDIPIGHRMSFMSTRRNGKPICLKDVVWVGKEPAPAVYFDFSSKGRRYRCLTPKACSNFLVEDMGAEPKPGLEVACSSPKELLPGRPMRVCLTVRNPGDGAESDVVVRLPVPAGATVTGLTADGAAQDGVIQWRVPALEAGASRELCATFGGERLGTFDWKATAKGAKTAEVSTECSTFIRGVPAILLEIVDLEDPIEVGGSVTYVIKVLNQGTLADTNVRVKCTLAASQEFVSGSGSTAVTAEGKTLTFAPVATLDPKGAVEWRLVVKAATEDDARFAVELSSDQFATPIHENESTRQY